MQQRTIPKFDNCTSCATDWLVTFVCKTSWKAVISIWKAQAVAASQFQVFEQETEANDNSKEMSTESSKMTGRKNANKQEFCKISDNTYNLRTVHIPVIWENIRTKSQWRRIEQQIDQHFSSFSESSVSGIKLLEKVVIATNMFNNQLNCSNEWPIERWLLTKPDFIKCTSIKCHTLGRPRSFRIKHKCPATKQRSTTTKNIKTGIPLIRWKSVAETKSANWDCRQMGPAACNLHPEKLHVDLRFPSKLTK